MPGPNKRISAKAFVTDLRAGMDDRALMQKHQLSQNGLGRILGRLLQAGILKESEIHNLRNSREAGPDELFECPACKKWHNEAFTECPHCGVVLAKFELRQADEADSQQSRPEGTVPEATIQDPAKLLNQQVPIKETQDKTADLTTQPANRVKELAADLGEIDFSQEILPLNESNVKSLKGDFLFWSVSFLGIVPLMIGILSDSHSQIVAFCLFFAFVWGAIFKKLIVQDSGSWTLALTALFFTGIVGIFLLLIIYSLMPSFYLKLAHSDNKWGGLFGYVFQVGLWEELCKILPVVIYVKWQLRKGRAVDPMTVVVMGVFSGLGFAAFENVDYARMSVLKSLALTKTFGVSGLAEGVKGAMVNGILRSLSLVFFHAVLSGIFAYFVALATVNVRRWGAFFLVGLGVSSILHGFYDWFCGVQQVLAAVTAGFSFMLFHAYIAKLRFSEHAIEQRMQAFSGSIG